METDKLSPTSLAFIALANEYCETIENCSNYSKQDFAETMLKLLPRIYISVVDIEPGLDFYDAIISPSLDEPSYDIVRNNIAAMMGEDETFNGIRKVVFLRQPLSFCHMADHDAGTLLFWQFVVWIDAGLVF